MIRDVPEDVVAAIDAKAQQAGLSRTEYLRRMLARECGHRGRSGGVTVEDLSQLAATFSDLIDSDVIDRAWARAPGSVSPSSD